MLGDITSYKIAHEQQQFTFKWEFFFFSWIRAGPEDRGKLHKHAV